MYSGAGDSDTPLDLCRDDSGIRDKSERGSKRGATKKTQGREVGSGVKKRMLSSSTQDSHKRSRHSV